MELLEPAGEELAKPLLRLILEDCRLKLPSALREIVVMRLSEREPDGMDDCGEELRERAGVARRIVSGYW